MFPQSRFLNVRPPAVTSDLATSTFVLAAAVFFAAAAFVVLAAVFLGATEPLIAAPTFRIIVPVDVPDDADILLVTLTVRGGRTLVAFGGALTVLLFVLDIMVEGFADLPATRFAKPAEAATAADLKGDEVGLSGETGRATGLLEGLRCWCIGD